MRKVYSLFSNSSIPNPALWLCLGLCITASTVLAGDPPTGGDNPPPCSVSIGPASVQDACPDQEPNLRGGPYLIQFTANPSGGGPYSHTWEVVNAGGTGANNSNLSNANTATVTFNTANLGRPGTVTLKYTVTGSCGTTSKLVTVNTNASPNAHLLPQWKCSASQGSYSATWNLNSEISPQINNGGAWTVKYYNSTSDAVNDNNAFNNSQANNYNVNSANKTIYARIQNSAGCWLAGPVSLNIWPTPGVNPVPDASPICVGAPTTVNGNPTGGAGGYTHAWTRVGGSVPSGNVSLSNTSSQVATVSGSSTGSIILRYVATDINGCSASATATVTVGGGSAISMTPLPDITVCPASHVDPIELSALPLGVNFTYSWSGGYGAGLSNGSASGADPEIPSFYSTANEGTWTVTVTASRPGYCDDEQTFNLTVRDVTPPTFIVCPADMTVNNDVDKCGANVNWQPPAAVDNCASLVNIYQVLPLSGKTTGDFFPVGNHTIKYIADDDYGNTSVCEFAVTVRDMQLPDIECPSGIQYLETNNGQCSHTLSGTYLNASVVENCGLDYVRNDYTNASTLNGAVFPAGSYPIVVTWKAEDWSGNTATCTFAVVVVDNDAPTVVSCPQDKTVSNDAGECGAHVWYA
ncbi:MAG: HYR domain-containing protein, partial [Saprospiraceae bacterium]|nr:HYR domain-containing protein [Saprospiraceae bacterium]